MKSKTQRFFDERFGEVRAINIDGVIYFYGIDVAKSLGYKNASKAVINNCKRVIIRVLGTTDTQNGKLVKRKVSLITKSDIYRLIVRSKLKATDEFESWIFDEILPSIESTGAYIESGREEEMVKNYFPSFSQETQLEMVNDLIKQNKQLKQFYDDLMNTENLISINTMAKELQIGEYALFSFLRRKKVFFYDKNKVNIPYERFRKEGKFQVKETMCFDGNIRSVTYATKKGLDYVRKLLRKDGYYNTLVTAN